MAISTCVTYSNCLRRIYAGIQRRIGSGVSGNRRVNSEKEGGNGALVGASVGERFARATAAPCLHGSGPRGNAAAHKYNLIFLITDNSVFRQISIYYKYF